MQSQESTRFERTPEELLGPLNDVERKNAPERLFLAGDLELMAKGSRVSIVGSRDATGEGKARAARLSRALALRKVTVVSGLAEGIDTVAHEVAMESGGRTIAVLGTPLDACFPMSNRALQQRIMREHLAITQFERQGGSRNFPMRNRTMALLTDVTVIIEAGEKSGTMHQGWEALRLGRPLFLVESLVATAHAWVEKLMQHGAQILSDRNFEEFLDSIPERTIGSEFAF